MPDQTETATTTEPMVITVLMPANRAARWSLAAPPSPQRTWPLAEQIIADGRWGGDPIGLDLTRGVGHRPIFRSGNKRLIYLAHRGGGEILVPVNLILPEPIVSPKLVDPRVINTP